MLLYLENTIVYVITCISLVGNRRIMMVMSNYWVVRWAGNGRNFPNGRHYVWSWESSLFSWVGYMLIKTQIFPGLGPLAGVRQACYFNSVWLTEWFQLFKIQDLMDTVNRDFYQWITECKKPVIWWLLSIFIECDWSRNMMMMIIICVK